jgi:putative ABC transport system ATP-binding protein
VLEAIERVNHDLGTLAVIITHNAAIADMANRVIHLSDAGSPRFMKQRAAPRADVVW